MKIPREKLEVRTARSGGPGGQGVNTTESKVEIRFHVASADWLPEKIRARFQLQNKNRINREGEFIISSETHRSQTKNLEDALTKLELLVLKASKAPKKRVKTKPSKAAKRKRIESKKRKGETKRQRQKPRLD